MRRLTLLLLASICVVSLTGCGWFKPGPGQTVQNFYQAVEKGEIESATGMLSSRIVANMGPSKLQQALAQQTQRIAASGGIDKITIEKEEIIGETATVVAIMLTKDGQSGTQNLTLLQEQGDWKIDFQGK